MSTIFSIDGNIGSGKSTILTSLKIIFNNKKDVIFLDEPVSEWEKIKDKNDVTILEKFYNTIEVYGIGR